MSLTLNFIVTYGYIILFLWVMVEQLGVPIPSMPLLITAGTLTATHRMSLPIVLVSVLAACLVSDSIWFFFGRRFGHTVVRLFCRLSLEASACVQRTENYFTRHGKMTMLVAKFIPGLGAVAAPIAGSSGLAYRDFLLLDGAGSLLWALTYSLIGRFFGDVLKQHPGALQWTVHFAAVLFIAGIVGLLVQRLLRQQAYLKTFRAARITPQELKATMDAGQPVYIIDLRHSLDILPDPRTLPGAHIISPNMLVASSADMPRDRDVVLFCTCPSEATAARTAYQMHKLGIYRVRPLRGGIDGWRALGYPLEDVDPKTMYAIQHPAPIKITPAQVS